MQGNLNRRASVRLAARESYLEPYLKVASDCALISNFEWILLGFGKVGCRIQSSGSWGFTEYDTGLRVEASGASEHGLLDLQF